MGRWTFWNSCSVCWDHDVIRQKVRIPACAHARCYQSRFLLVRLSFFFSISVIACRPRGYGDLVT
ncbi:hypothetical protein BDZ91DRAFT_370719 [Kalaharituber pfeilii]|nr:hypothetical protein BDZ91DRAFT_370719 [Kalaharituber pfeilii]